LATAKKGTEVLSVCEVLPKEEDFHMFVYGCSPETDTSPVVRRPS
jgi:hypothetical protein